MLVPAVGLDAHSGLAAGATFGAGFDFAVVGNLLPVVGAVAAAGGVDVGEVDVVAEAVVVVVVEAAVVVAAVVVVTTGVAGVVDVAASVA